MPWSKSLALSEMAPSLPQEAGSQTLWLGPRALWPPTLSSLSLQPGAIQGFQVGWWNPTLRLQSHQSSNSFHRFGSCLEPLLGPMALSGTGTLVASIVSKIASSAAMVKAGGAVSGTILAGSQGECPWKGGEWTGRGQLQSILHPDLRAAHFLTSIKVLSLRKP